MNARRFAVFPAALLAAAAFTAGTTAVAVASPAAIRPMFTGYAEGYGPTLQDAQQNANAQIPTLYSGCKMPYTLVKDGQYANGTWWAQVAAYGCTGYI